MRRKTLAGIMSILLVLSVLFGTGTSVYAEDGANPETLFMSSREFTGNWIP